MSFPSDLQASVRAQLADCLVGLSCQRLDFLSAHRLRVPRCEILLPSSGAKGTIRAGNFSQIANVLQSGGDEGMWTFDRYQRWMQQVNEWVRPAPAPAPRGAADQQPRAMPARALRPMAPPVASAPLQARPKPVAPKLNPGAALHADEVFEVPAEEMDLAQLAELAKKVVERKP
jgi:twitching motility protein PilT